MAGSDFHLRGWVGQSVREEPQDAIAGDDGCGACVIIILKARE